MDFEWDDAKSARNVAERGLPFDVAMALFDNPTLEEPDQRRDYGETRIRAIGQVNGVILVCIYTDRGRIRRIISLRPAKERERHAYRETYPR
ncbi:BrnT family toxin [Azospirillum sp. SYSU D00513]|uniref:BrnT family toxin n=1 Tax=Azospirillum sp. SYSU D00513 TaxID=2812561 RepID=UPI001A976550|nr:BrnT family toxin [Azospirillum sp. SYSU D00513]